MNDASEETMTSVSTMIADYDVDRVARVTPKISDIARHEQQQCIPSQSVFFPPSSVASVHTAAASAWKYSLGAASRVGGFLERGVEELVT